LKSIRDLLEDETIAAEEAIKDILQKFHNVTGMIPNGVSFEVIDTKSFGPAEPRKVIWVSSVNLTAST